MGTKRLEIFGCHAPFGHMTWSKGAHVQSIISSAAHARCGLARWPRHSVGRYKVLGMCVHSTRHLDHSLFVVYFNGALVANRLHACGFKVTLQYSTLNPMLFIVGVVIACEVNMKT